MSSRSSPRNVFFYDGTTGDLLGGLKQNGSVTQANFFDMLVNTLLAVTRPISITSQATGQAIAPSHVPLAEGNYDIICTGGRLEW